MPGAWNMSLDEALVHAVASGASPGTLRFYQWSEPTLSLGYFQQLEDRRLHQASKGCPLVRRSSGGGAILHHHELTYSLALQVDDRFASRKLYTSVHEALLEVLASWSILAELFASDATAARASFLCFERRTPGDVILRGAKVCGSAQRRIGSAVLQHGSLLLSRSDCAPELPGLHDLGGITPQDFAALPVAWKTALERRLRLGSFTEGNWTKQEIADAGRWELERYGETGWISRR